MATSETLAGTTKAGPLAVLERILHEGFATGDDGIVDEVCAPDLVEHQSGLAGTRSSSATWSGRADERAAPRRADSSGRPATRRSTSPSSSWRASSTVAS